MFDEEDSNVCAHKHISRGNAEEAIRNSKYVISHHFETPWTEHAFLEPECAVAFYDEDGDVFFPEFNENDYVITKGETLGDEIKYTRTVYVRKQH